MATNTLERTRQDLRWVPVGELKPYRGNARRHSKKQIQAIARSIERFRFTAPVLVDENSRLLAGHGRVEAAKLLGLDTVPTVRIDHLNDDEKRAYVIADNRLAERAGWDQETLAIELEALTELDFPVELTGFDVPEVEIIIAEHGSECGDDDDPDDELPARQEQLPAVTRPGDVWVLGEHRLLCGDARDASAYDRLLEGETVRVAITDPPYNVPVNGHVSGLGRHRHREFAVASGEMSRPQFQGFLETVFLRMAAVSEPGALHYVFMDWRHLGEILAAGETAYDELLNLIVWDKGSGGMGGFYRSRHELVLLFRAVPGRHRNNVELGRHGRNRTNVRSYRGMASFGAGRDEALASHPTVKPVAMIADALRDCSSPNDLVLDPFSGSGITLIAAQKTRRRARVMEIDPHYCDVAVRRWQAFTGKEARHEQTGFSLTEREEIGGIR